MHSRFQLFKIRSAGLDPENSERGGQDTCPLASYIPCGTKFLREFILRIGDFFCVLWELIFVIIEIYINLVQFFP